MENNWKADIDGWDRDEITPEILAEHGDTMVHVLCGPNSWVGNWMYAMPKRHNDYNFEIGGTVGSSKFATGRWTLSDAYERTKHFTRAPVRECIFEKAEAITYKPCPLCGCYAVLGEARHGEQWGSWVVSLRCSSSHCGCAVTLPSSTTCLEEQLASKWNSRVT